MARRVLRGGGFAEPEGRSLPEPSLYSEWAQVAVLRTQWKPKAPRLTVAWADGKLCSELARDQHVLWSGECAPRVTVNGCPLPAPRSWEEVCWVTDDDVDYLELEGWCGADWRVQRQMLLARDDRFLLLADAVAGPTAGTLDYELALPLAPGVKLLSTAETTEVQLEAGERAQALVLPLAAPEWQRESRHRPLATQESDLVYRQQAQGAAMFAPLFIDLKPKRLTARLTWRQLTVAESRQIVRPDAAVGFRAQVGHEQWVFYRSLAEGGNRTVLGANVNEEFIAARFNTLGEWVRLLAVE